MSMEPRALEWRLRLAGIFVALGLLTEFVTLLFVHALAFLAFVFLGGGLVGLGVILYLLTIVRV